MNSATIEIQTMRLFIAITPDEETSNQISGMVSEIQDVGKYFRPVETNHYHVTVRFLGEVERGKAEELHDQLVFRMKDTDGFQLETNDVVFGIGGNKLALCIQNNEQLTKLRAAVDAALRSSGVQVQEDRYLPHISLTRAQRFITQDDRKLIEHGIKGMTFHRKFDVRSIHLIQSELTQDRSVYSTVFTIPLNPILP